MFTALIGELTMSPAPNQIDIWLINVTTFWQNRLLENVISELPEDENRRAKKIKNNKKKLQFVAARFALRRILSGWVKDSKPSDFILSSTDKGKPCLTGRHSKTKFNISHSNDLIVIGVANDIEIGIDVEYINESRNLKKISEACFTEDELKEHCLDNVLLNPINFYQLWTHKEAILKAIGCGLRFPMKAFSVKQDELFAHKSGTNNFNQLGGKEWCVSPLEIAHDYRMSVAHEKCEPKPDIKLLHFLISEIP